MALTDKEIQEIRDEALDKYCSPYGKPNPETYAYIAGITKERERVKPLLRALEEISMQATCEEQMRENRELGDIEHAYDEIIDVAKTALTNYNKSLNQTP